jgi:CRP-like cAMP-binding protein
MPAPPKMVRSGMDAALREAILHLPTVDYAVGEVIIMESKEAHGLYFLESGTVEVFKGATRVATESTPGAVFGEMALLLNSVATATVRAREACRFYVARDGAGFLAAHPQVGFYLAHLLATRLETITRYVADVKAQFKQSAAHLGMVDGVVDTLLVKQPRFVVRKNRGH